MSAFTKELLQLAHGPVSNGILGSFYHVYNDVGPGFPESNYHNALKIAFQKRNIRYESEVRFVVQYEGIDIGIFRADLIVEGCIVVEIKCAESIHPQHVRQALHYLKASKLHVALILNFGPSPTFKRIIR